MYILNLRALFYRKMFRTAMRSARYWRTAGNPTMVAQYKDEARLSLQAFRHDRARDLSL